MRPPGTPWHRVVLAVLVCALATWAVVGSYKIEPHLSANADEHVYVQQAWLTAHGRLTVPTLPGALAPSFRPWFSITSDRGYIFKYSPVWPATLALGDVIGISRLSLGLVAALFVLGVYLLAEAVLQSERRAVLAAALVALAPLTIVQSITLFSYIQFGALWTLAAAFILRGVRSHRTGELAAAGIFGVLAASARPYDALLVLAPFLGWAAWTLLRGRRVVRPTLVLGLSAAPLVAGQLVYDKVVTGSWLTLPFSRYSRFDKVGYGLRGLGPDTAGYFGIHQGIHGVLKHIWLLHTWSLGGFVLAAVALYGLATAWQKTGAVPTALAAVALPLGYLYFWGSLAILGGFGPRYGPYYFLPVLVPVAVFAAQGLAELWARWRIVATVALCGMLTLAGFTVDHALSLAIAERDSTAQANRLLDNIERSHARSLVFVPGVLIGHLVPGRFSHGVGPGTRVLYAISREAVDLRLVEAVPGRVPYRLQPCDWPGGPIGTRRVPASGPYFGSMADGRGARMVPLHVEEGATVALRVTVPPSTSASPVTVTVSAGTLRATVTAKPSAIAEAIDVVIASTSISVSGPAQNLTRGGGRDDGLSVHMNVPNATAAPTVYAWDTAMRVAPGDVSVLAPAVLTVHQGTQITTMCTSAPPFDVAF